MRRLQRPPGVHAGCPGVPGRLEGGARWHHPPRRQDAVRGERGHGAQAHGGAAQGLRSRLLRHVRAGLRARSDRGVADRRDQRHGAGGRDQHHLPEGDYRRGRSRSRPPAPRGGVPQADRSVSRRRRRPHR